MKSLQNLRAKAFVYKARFLSPEVDTNGHDGTKSWFSHTQAEWSQN